MRSATKKDYFDDIPRQKARQDAMDLAKHIVQTKVGHFRPGKFEDRYEKALHELIAKKQAGELDRSSEARASQGNKPYGCVERKSRSGERRREEAPQRQVKNGAKETCPSRRDAVA